MASNGAEGGVETASAALLIGGTVKSGKILADWPRLGFNDLHEDHDLRPMLDLDKLQVYAGTQAGSIFISYFEAM